MKLKYIAIIVMLLFTTATAVAEDNVKNTDEAKLLYGKFGDAVYQVQVIDLASGEKTSIGSGFQISDKGLLATNYHVVAEKVNRPKNNRIDFLSDKGKRGDLEILYVDVVNDLAILKMSEAGSKFLTLSQGNVAKGSKMFSIGNPHDIGFTIIEGTYNGIAEDSFIDKIHFSGSLNAGMSGGPTINHLGNVVGINVATAGNQISFLVPVEKLSDLLKKVDSFPQGYKFIETADEEIQKQLLARQNKDIEEILNKEWVSANFGGKKLPGSINDKLKCWGGINHKEKDDYKYFYSMCASQDRIFIDNDFFSGAIAYRYNYLQAKDNIIPAQFYNFYESEYRRPMNDYKNAREEDVTKFACNDGNLEVAGDKWKSSLCVRKYKKYPKLYDMYLYMADVGNKTEGLSSVLIGQGLSEENIIKISRKFISEIKQGEEIAQ